MGARRNFRKVGHFSAAWATDFKKPKIFKIRS